MPASQLTASSGPTLAVDGFISPPCSTSIREEDMRLVAMTFVATGLTVLLASLVLDIGLSIVMINGARSLETVASFRLATELLPLCLVFTAFAAFLTGVAVIYVKAQLQRADIRSAASLSGSQLPNLQFGFA